MNSIDRNQHEMNHQDLQGSAAAAKIHEIVERARCCFFCTGKPGSPESGTRPMSVLRVDDDGHLWFLSASDSLHNKDLISNPEVQLYFQASPHSGFLHLKGSCTISADKARIHELWEPLFQTWFTAGIDDPRITVLEVTPREGYYWDNKNGNFIAGIKMMIGAALGTTMDDSIAGRLNP